MSSFVDRLTACARQGSLSTSDLAYWFDVPQSTMWTWLHGRSEPDGTKRSRDVDLMQSRLTLLEKYIKKHGGFPVPFEVGGHNRPRYIRDVRDGNGGRLPGADTSAGRI